MARYQVPAQHNHWDLKSVLKKEILRYESPVSSGALVDMHVIRGRCYATIWLQLEISLSGNPSVTPSRGLLSFCSVKITPVTVSSSSSPLPLTYTSISRIRSQSLTPRFHWTGDLLLTNHSLAPNTVRFCCMSQKGHLRQCISVAACCALIIRGLVAVWLTWRWLHAFSAAVSRSAFDLDLSCDPWLYTQFAFHRARLPVENGCRDGVLSILVDAWG